MLGIDYAWQHPDPQALEDAGYQFACRYLSRDESKNLSLAEAQALAAHGIWVVANWEYGAQDALRGKAGGIADAQLALAQAKAAGMPDGRPIYFSVDWDVTPAQEQTVLDYLAGVASVLGKADTGEYAGYYPAKIAADSGYVWTWQTTGWSGGQWDPRAAIRQTGSATVGGVQVDTNQAMRPDFGQWQPGRLPTTPQETIMSLGLDDLEAIAQWIENRKLGQIPDQSQTTTLGVETASSPARWAQLFARLDEITAAVKQIGTPPPASVDLAALEALIEQHFATGSVPGVIAAAVLQHLSAATAGATP